MKNGPYEMVRAPDDYPGLRYRGCYVYEHHLVWWGKTGNLVSKGWVVHHKNDRKRDNRFSNLELKRHGAHSADHNRERGTSVDVECSWCGKSFTLSGRTHRLRLKQSTTGRLFCCRSHQVKQQWKDNPHRLKRSSGMVK